MPSHGRRVSRGARMPLAALTDAAQRRPVSVTEFRVEFSLARGTLPVLAIGNHQGTTRMKHSDATTGNVPKGSARIALLAWRTVLLFWLPILALLVGAILFAQKVVHPAPTSIRILSGPDGSSYRRHAEKYKKIIEAYGVKVVVLPSQGALDNLQRLADRKAQADVGFVQGGLTDGVDVSHLVSLGSVFAQPLMVYYRMPETVERLSQLKGKRLAIGPTGSGARALTLKLLKANEIDGPPTELHELTGEEAANELIAGKLDAVFLMGDSATPAIMRKLRQNDDIEIANFSQADGYLRKFRFLSKLTLPEGAYDLGKNEPPRTLSLVGPTVELVAREDLHPALSDLLISAAKEVHGGAGLFRNAGEYPLQEVAVLVGQPGRSPDRPRGSASGHLVPGDQADADRVPVVDEVAHLQVVRRAHEHRAGHVGGAQCGGPDQALATPGRHRQLGQSDAYAGRLRRSALRAAGSRAHGSTTSARHRARATPARDRQVGAIGQHRQQRRR
jgi:TRAP-type uncharacterized transport system substrate-binding protein